MVFTAFLLSKIDILLNFGKDHPHIFQVRQLFEKIPLKLIIFSLIFAMTIGDALVIGLTFCSLILVTLFH